MSYAAQLAEGVASERYSRFVERVGEIILKNRDETTILLPC
jgi:hypothetical protein